MVQASVQSHGWLDGDAQGQMSRHLRLAVVWSMVLHLIVLMVATWVRWPRHGEQPLASIEVSLASLPSPAAKLTEPAKLPVKPPVKPVEAAQPPASSAPAPPVKIAPAARTETVVPAKPVRDSMQDLLKDIQLPSAARTSTTTPPKPARDSMQDLLKDIQLPPDAPKLGDFSPADKPKKNQEPIASSNPKLKLPDVPVVQNVKDLSKKPADPKPRASLIDESYRELDKTLSQVGKLELPTESKPAPVEEPQKPTPQVEAKLRSVKTVDTTLKVPGVAPGSNAYLARVRQRISSVWVAPPVDVTAQVYSVVVKFRLHRNGSVSGVAIEQSSGNEYYDLAGKRAVVNAEPLPGFPPELTESSFDAHFTFTVGEPNG